MAFVLGDESRLGSMRDRWAAEASQEDMRDRWAAEASQEDAAMERRDRSRSRERDDGMDELCNAMDYCYPDMPELVAASDDESDGGDADAGSATGAATRSGRRPRPSG